MKTLWERINMKTSWKTIVRKREKKSKKNPSFRVEWGVSASFFFVGFAYVQHKLLDQINAFILIISSQLLWMNIMEQRNHW